MERQRGAGMVGWALQRRGSRLSASRVSAAAALLPLFAELLGLRGRSDRAAWRLRG